MRPHGKVVRIAILEPAVPLATSGRRLMNISRDGPMASATNPLIMYVCFVFSVQPRLLLLSGDPYDSV